MTGFGGEVAMHSTSADPFPGEPDCSLPILFLHVPRTAGFTLKTVLESIFGMKRTLLDVHSYDTREDDLTRFAVVEGHASARFFRRSFGSQWHANGITMLRDPVARTVSQARHIRARPSDRRHHHLESGMHDPTELFKRVPLLVNLQTKLLSGRRVDDETIDASALLEARTTLEQLAFGLTEAFDSSLALFAERFSLDLPKFGKLHALPASGDDDLRSEEFRAAALEHNDLDQQLYRYASTLFSERIAGYLEGLLELPLDEGRFEHDLRVGQNRVDEDLPVPADTRSVLLEGSVLVDGRAPDAVLARAGDRTTPLCARVFDPAAASATSSAHNRYAGVTGTVEIPTGARAIELFAFDRKRRIRSEHTFEITVAPPMRKERITRLRRNAFARLARLQPSRSVQ